MLTNEGLCWCSLCFLYLLQILKLEKAEPKPVETPPPETQPLQPVPQNRQRQPQSAQAGPASLAPAPSPTNGLHPDYNAHRRGSAWPYEGSHTAPSTPSMRRYDSHSLLSDNSIASSRMDLMEGLPYPEWVALICLCHVPYGAVSYSAYQTLSTVCTCSVKGLERWELTTIIK